MCQSWYILTQYLLDNTNLLKAIGLIYECINVCVDVEWLHILVSLNSNESFYLLAYICITHSNLCNILF